MKFLNIDFGIISFSIISKVDNISFAMYIEVFLSNTSFNSKMLNSGVFIFFICSFNVNIIDGEINSFNLVFLLKLFVLLSSFFIVLFEYPDLFILDTFLIFL